MQNSDGKDRSQDNVYVDDDDDETRNQESPTKDTQSSKADTVNETQNAKLQLEDPYNSGFDNTMESFGKSFKNVNGGSMIGSGD